ncbi:hypothetical protein BJ912DRAFT_927667 [Pholiota molesta]|nr:hypothetical protein BJ912DRAFT_927667 [Pholiota molesta]
MGKVHVWALICLLKTQMALLLVAMEVEVEILVEKIMVGVLVMEEKIMGKVMEKKEKKAMEKKAMEKKVMEKKVMEKKVMEEKVEATMEKVEATMEKAEVMVEKKKVMEEVAEAMVMIMVAAAVVVMEVVVMAEAAAAVVVMEVVVVVAVVVMVEAAVVVVQLIHELEQEQEHEQHEHQHHQRRQQPEEQNHQLNPLYSAASNIALPEKQALHNIGLQFIAAIASQAVHCLPDALSSTTNATHPQTPQRLLEALINNNSRSSSNVLVDSDMDIQDNVLRSMVHQAQHANINQTTLYTMLEPHIDAKVSSIRRYVADGTSCCALAGAGSFYILILMAGAGKMRPQIRMWEGDTAGRIAKLIRNPIVSGDDPASNLIIKTIIPAIAYLRKKYPLEISIFFPVSFLESFMGINNVDCTHLNSTDLIWDALYLYNDFIKCRNWSTWLACSGSVLDPSQFPSLSISAHNVIRQPALDSGHIESSNIFTIGTNFNPSLKFNSERDVKKQRFTYTEIQRNKAQAAIVAENLDDFQAKIQSQLEKGRRANDQAYVRLSTTILNNSSSQPIRINNQKEDLIAMILPHMPEDIRGTLLDQLRIICPNLGKVDSASEGAGHGDGTPSNAEPTTLVKNHKRKRTNTCQNIPRRSNELKDNPEPYCMLQDTFKPLFAWLEAQIKALLPKSYMALSHFVDILPYSDISPVYPFGGFVVNINVTTKIHRDHGDHDICLVVVISDCTGDRSGLSWAKDRNGWGHNDFMRTIQKPLIYIILRVIVQVINIILKNILILRKDITLVPHPLSIHQLKLCKGTRSPYITNYLGNKEGVMQINPDDRGQIWLPIFKQFNFD